MNTKQMMLVTNEFEDNEYLDKYVSLIESNSNSDYINCKSNKHHIIPRYVFKKQNKPIDNSDTNTVNLLYKDHALAHFYLAGCALGRGKYWNIYAIYRCSGQKYFDTECIEFIEKLQDFQNIYENAVHGTPNHRKGAKVTKETIEKMRTASRERINKYGSTTKNRVWMNNGIHDKMVSEKDIDKFKNDGYSFGRTLKHTDEWKKQQGIRSTGKRSAEFCEKMRLIALNQPEKTQESISKQKESVRTFYKTHDNPFKGKHHTKESLEKMRKALSGKIAINKDAVKKMIYETELEAYIQQGWHKGGIHYPRHNN